MQNLTKSIIVLLVLAFSTSLFAAGKYGVIGKIYTSEKALEIYGPVSNSIEMERSELEAYLEQIENYMMFTIKNNEIVIADDNRNVLTNNKIFLTSSILNIVSKNDAISEDETLYMFSKSKVYELIERGGKDIVKFEKRENVITINSGFLDMDLSHF